jgi:hypothetical protein
MGHIASARVVALMHSLCMHPYALFCLCCLLCFRAQLPSWAGALYMGFACVGLLRT